MDLILNNKYISEPIYNIITKLKKESHKKFFTKIEDKGEYIRCTCPFHAGGHEQHPSFSVYASYDNPDIIPGTYHCFTCDSKGQLYQLVAYCLDIDEESAINWLLDNFSDIYAGKDIDFPDLILEPEKPTCLDESILDKYNTKHAYMYERKLKDNIIEEFKIGYNKENNSITFPIWDDQNRLIGITERCVDNKKFYIPHGLNKPVYLFNVVKNKNYPYVIVCESQIDALTAWGYGVPAVAMLGTGCKEQYQILNKRHINWITMFDNDAAGRLATKRFNENIRSDCFITNIELPPGRKDINDLSQEEFDELLEKNNLHWKWYWF